MTVAEAARAVSGASLIGDGAVPFTDIVYDSRAVTPGALFVALRGADVDGHTFIPNAIAAGACVAMVDRDDDWTSIGVPVIVAADTRAALAPLSAAFFGHPSREIPVIGVTGTDGKTTTSYMVDHLLRAAGATTGLAGTVAVRIAGEEDRHSLRQTTQESVENQRLLRRMIDAGCDVAILEATSHGLDLHRLDSIDFQVGAVTNITHEHLEHHGTIEAYRRAKAILFERLGPGGAAVVNLDDEGAKTVLPYVGEGVRTIGYTRRGAADAALIATNVERSTNGSRFDLRHGDDQVSVWLPAIGDFNIDNALCAVGVAIARGLSLQEVGSALGSVPSPPGRMVRVDQGQPFSVVVDYAHTPESLAKVLDLLRGLTPAGRLIVVFGSAGDRDPTKRPIQGEVAGRLADYVILANEDPRTEDPMVILEEIAVGARAGGKRDGVDLDLIPDRADAIARAVAVARGGDTILLAGKGHEGSIIIGHDKLPWDEETAARDALRAAGFSGPVD